jgi:hypothetical protein
MSEQLEQAERRILGWIDRDITGPMAAAQGALYTEARRPEQD